MPSTQRSHSAPSRNGRTDSDPDSAPSPGLLRPTRWHTTRTQQPQQPEESPGSSHEAGEAQSQGPGSVTRTNSTVASSGVEQKSDTMTSTPDSGRPNGDDPWVRKTLLTLDGGGVRGFSSLLILRALMMEIANLEQGHSQTHSSVHPLQPRLRRRVRMQNIGTRTSTFRRGLKTQQSESLIRLRTSTWRRDPNTRQSEGPIHGPACASSLFLPAHYFDYIAGTSTGGLIAIMLGRLHMTVEECLEVYENLADHVFGHPRHLHIRRPPWIPRDKYDHSRLEEVIKEVVSQRSPTGHNSTGFRQPDESMCRTIVLAWEKYDTGTEVPHLFRSYHHPESNKPDHTEQDPGERERNPGEPDNHCIWQVGRATSAAPTYFRTVRLEEDDEKSDYIDGGFGANNPTEEAYRSVKQLYNNNQQAVRVLVSIGTGKNLGARRNPSAGFALYMAYANRAAKWATQSEKTHQTMLDLTRDYTEYYRLNVQHGIGKMKLDAWKGKKGCKTLELIRTKTQDYLDSAEGQRQITASARELVNIRRARSSQAHLDRWERFCHGVKYACCVATCSDGKDTMYDRQALRQHVEGIHPSECYRLDSLLNEGKRFPNETTA